MGNFWTALDRIGIDLSWRILVTGSSTFREEDRWVVESLLNGIERELKSNCPGITITITDGACPTGLDKIANQIAVEKGWETIRIPTNWYAPCHPECRHRPRKIGGHCPAQGMYRNQKMVDMGHDMCIGWFAQPKSPGTLDCLTKAYAARINTAYVANDGYGWKLRDFPGGDPI